MGSMRRSGAAAGVAMVALLAVGCSSSEPQGEAAAGADTSVIATGEEVVGAGLEVTSFDTLNDWVTYAELVAAVTVVSEAELPPRPSDTPGGHNVARDLRLRVDEVLAGSAPEAPEITLTNLGWVRADDGSGVLRPFRFETAPRFEVGSSYVVALYREKPGGPYGTWTTASVLRLEGGVVAEVPGVQMAPPARELVGMTPRQVADRLAREAPLPTPPELAGLAPSDRKNEMKARGGGPSTPVPSATPTAPSIDPRPVR